MGTSEKPAPWFFNLRASKGWYDEDSDDSDSHLDASKSTSTISEETRFLDDLDLASRKENVDFKPNPFSIAKINAASRPAVPTSRNLQPIRVGKPSATPKTGGIVDGFKRQTEKAHGHAQRGNTEIQKPGPILAAKLKSAAAQKTPASFHSSTPKNNTDVSGFCRQPSPIPITYFPNADATLTPHSSNSRLRSARICDEALSEPPPISDLLASTVTTGGFKTRIEGTGERERRGDAAKLGPSSTLAPKLGITAPAARIPARNNFGTPRGSPGAPERYPQPSPALSHCYSDTINQTPDSHPSSAHINDSLVQLCSSPDLLVSAAPAATNKQHIRRNRNRVPSFSSPARPTWGQANIASTSTFSSPFQPPASYSLTARDHARFPPSWSNAFFSDMHATLLPKSPVATPRSQVAPPDDLYEHPAEGEITETFISADDTLYGSNSSSPPNTSVHEIQTLSRIQIPESPRRRVKTPNHREARNAYDFLTPNPDEEWSTLPQRKKPKLSGAPLGLGIKRSGKFRVPIVNVNSTVRTGMSATSARRVVTYLPPPLIKSNARDENTSASLRSDDEANAQIEDDINIFAYSVEHSYPSPSQPRVPVTRRPQSPDTTPQSYSWNRVAYRPPSPPSSDPPPQCNRDGDVSAEINLRDIAERVPEAKRIRRERRASSAGVWDLLGLPSCGYVYQDSGEHEDGEQEEVRIVVWNGLLSLDEGMLN